MNTPITINFFKKIELYQEVLALNKIFRDAVDQQKRDKSKNTWEIEKKFLRWTRSDHKHLGSPVNADDFKSSNDANKLNDVMVSEQEVEDKEGGGQYWLGNLVRRGYAEYGSAGSKEGILINEKGLLLGAILFDIYKVKKITEQKLWHRWFWSRYEKHYNAEYFLAKRYKYWFYWLFVKVGWVVFWVAVALVIWAFGEKIIGAID